MHLHLDDIQATAAALRTEQEAFETLKIATMAAHNAAQKTPGVFSVICAAVPHSNVSGMGEVRTMQVALKTQPSMIYACLSGIGAVTSYLPLKQRLKIAMGVIMGKDVGK